MNKQTDILAKFGRRLRTLRTLHGLSQEAFADLCGLDRTYVGGVERGERNVALRNIAAFARALNISISELTEDIENL
jgi:transcriptional regulator with XRE-family HTH domain